MSEKLRALFEKISGDDSLREAFYKGMETISNEDEKKSFIIDFAKEQGITLTEEDFSNIDGVQHLSDEDLENVVGGAYGDTVYRQCKDKAYAVCSWALGFAGLMDCT